MDRLADLITGARAAGRRLLRHAVRAVVEGGPACSAPVLDFAIWPIQLAIPLGFASAAVRYLFYAAWPSLRPQPPEFQE